jgi:hypothetical protein
LATKQDFRHVQARITLPAAAILLIALSSSLPGQDDARLWRIQTDTLTVGDSDTLRLSRQFVFEGDAVISILPAIEYDSVDIRLLGRDGLLLVHPVFRKRLIEGNHRVVLRYRALPFSFETEYRRRTLELRRTDSGDDNLRVAVPSRPLDIESIFGSELNKSGYLGRGFTVGSNRDLNINSGFRLQLSGKLSDDISIIGALTDENTPIQPEGNTRTIQELDKVFIKLSSRKLSATLGDFNLSYSDTEFGRYSRKLSGVLGEGAWKDGMASLSYASLKGTFNSMQFNGMDGVQGPYRLTAANGKQPILVLAGTERVWVDGIAMVRGESNDYVIEYASGELTFTPRRLITSYSRITVDYEYAEREYTRTMLTASTRSSFLSSRLTVGARFILENDDPDNPIDQPLDDVDRALLAEVGDDAAAATRGGAVYVGYDDERRIGNGQYALIDTTIQGQDILFFRYEPGSDSATWVLTFSFVGNGNGDYRRKSIGIFEYAGQRAGNYTPGRRIPLPRSHRLLNLTAGYTPLRDLTVSGELALSSLDLNRFSTRDSDDDDGDAFNLALSWKEARTAIGTLDVSARHRSSASTFAPIDRINDIEFSRRWDLASAGNAREDMSEFALGLTPLNGLLFNAGAGLLRQGSFASQRLDGGVTLSDVARDSARPDATWRIEHIRSDDERSATVGRWLRQTAQARHRTPYGDPRLRIEQEHRTVFIDDSLSAASLAFIDIRPGIEFTELFGMALSADVGVRFEDAVIDNELSRRSVDILQQYGITMRTWRDFSGNLALTIRDRNFTDAFALRGERDFQTILTRAQARYSPLKGGVTADMLYEISTERTSRLERVFLSVPTGQGNYVYVGDLNNNGIQDENEFEPTRYDGDYVLLNVPTEELFPVIDLKTSLRLRMQPDRFLATASGALASALRALSSETLLRIDEKSEDENTSNVYLLRTSGFLNDSNTVRGFQNLRQDLFLFERAADFSMRLRFDERRGFNKYALVTERSYRREQSARIRTQLVREIALQTDLIRLSDAVHSSQGGSRARDIISTELAGDLSYRPWQQLEIGFVLSSRSAVDRLPALPVEASIASQTLRCIASFDGPGRLRIELERNTVDFSTEVERFPYELTDGRAEGLSWVWRLNFDYRITAFMQATVSYLGRSETERNAIHTARAEVKAFF